MISNRKKRLLPVATATGSFFLMVILALSTSPLTNVTYAILFFALLAIFLISIGYGLVYIHSESVSVKNRFRIMLISFLIVIALMLRSSQALNWAQVLILLVIGCGLWFYSGRR